MRKALAIAGSAIFLAIAPGFVAGLVPWWISRWRIEAPFLGMPLLRAPGAVLIALGAIVLLDSFARFALQGVGTPAPVFPTSHLVVTGLYRFVRNPMYTAVVSAILGQALLLGNVALLEYGALVWLLFHLFVLLYEEPTLRATFGSEYESFCAGVPRWIPRFTPWCGPAPHRRPAPHSGIVVEWTAMRSPFFGEFMGTLILILMGNGVVAGVLLNRSKAEGAGWVAITAGWAFAVMTGVFTAIACGSPDAHLNPAVTLGFAVKSGDYSHLAPYAAAQLLGAVAGAVLVWLAYYPHWAVTKDPAAKQACFATAPAIPHRAANLLAELIGTFVLILLVAAITSKAVNAPFAPPLVGMLVWAIGLSLGGMTGYAINPARDLGPRIAHAMLPIAGKGDSGWGYAPVPILGPLLGAALAGAFVAWVGM